MSAAPNAEARGRFYRAALLGLAALDVRGTGARRLGEDADVRWSQFAGALEAGDRLDILLRDASVSWGAAFSPSACFGFSGLSEDEAFGPEWAGIDDATAKRLFETVGAPSLENAVSSLGLAVTPLPIPGLSASTKLIVAGDSAVISVARAFAADASLSWADQIVVVAQTPTSRQLASLAGILVGSRARTPLLRPLTDAASALRAIGFVHIDQAIVSPDADDECAAYAQGAGGPRGAS